MRAFIALVMSASLLSGIAAAGEAVIEGKWMRGDGNTLVHILPCGTNMCATNLWIGDTSNGEEVGDRLEMSLVQDSANIFSGKAYDPKRKLTYSIVVTARKDGLATRGCFVGKFICKEVVWTAAE